MDRLRYTIEVAELQLAEAEGKVARQRELVEQMRVAGWDAALAESLLRTMERTLRLMRDDVRTMRRLGVDWARAAPPTRH